MTSNVAVIGGGTMGTGIAYVSAMAGFEVSVVEPDETRAAGLERRIREATDGGIKRGKLNREQADALIDRISCTSRISGLPAGLHIAIESVSESLELKRRVLSELAQREPDVIGTNTSALSIDDLAEVLPAPDRFLGMHFFNPVWSFRLVELVRGAGTSEATLEKARAFVEQIGKVSLTVNNVPGYATSRLDIITSLEAMRILEDGVASAEDVDRAALLAFRHPVGPLELSDVVGLDVRLDVARVLERAYGSRFTPPEILVRMVEQGKLGQKTGEGFFTWSDKGVVKGKQTR